MNINFVSCNVFLGVNNMCSLNCFVSHLKYKEQNIKHVKYKLCHIKKYAKIFKKKKVEYKLCVLQCFPRSQKCVFSNLLLPGIN